MGIPKDGVITNDSALAPLCPPSSQSRAHLENSFLFLATRPKDLTALAEQLIHRVFVPNNVDGKSLQEGNIQRKGRNQS